MTFSNVNIFRSAVTNVRASEPGSGATKIVRGGAFSPNTQEAIAIMRSDTDNQWENSYITKYQALMQNRINRLRQDLTNAYKALLEMSSVQQIRENGANSSNSSLTDIYGRLIKDKTFTDANNDGIDDDGMTDAFKGLTYFDNNTLFDTADVADGSAGDGVPSYYFDALLRQNGGNQDPAGAGDRNGKIEMRRLYVAGPALQIANSMKVTFRTEEVPTKFTNPLGPFPIPVGEKAYVPGQKVAEYSADVKSGGFFSTLNYLYNFAPRELKYSYPTAYSTTTEETGSRQVAGKQAVLFNNQITDARDVLSGGNGDAEDDPIPTYDDDGNRPPNGSRVKWSTSNSSQGYLTERSPVFPQKTPGGSTIGDAYDDRAITRRVSDNDGEFNLNGTLAQADNVVKATWAYNAGSTTKQTIYGVEDRLGGGTRIDDKIKWEYNHDGIGAADLNQDGNINGADVHTAKAIFINHYQVATQTVELNSSSESYGAVKALNYNGVDTTTNGGGGQRILRSSGIDGSAEHVFNDENEDKIQQNNPSEKLLLAGSSKIAKNFDGKYVANLYSLQSFNGQNVATDSANVNINSKNDKDKVVVAEYEGFKRAQSMNKGLADDYFSEINSDERTEDDARRLAKKLETEINATSMVDTDWHYSEYMPGNDSIMFRNIKEVTFKNSIGAVDKISVNYNPALRDNVAVTDPDFNNVVVGFRKTFSLEPREFQIADYSTPVNNDLYINTPTFADRDVYIDVVTDNSTSAPDLIVNGKVVPRTAINTVGTTTRTTYNLRGFLKEGDNVIGAQVKFGGTGVGQSISGDAFKIEPSTVTPNPVSDVTNWLNKKVSTDRTQNGDISASKLNPSNVSALLSSWQSKIMVDKIEPAFFDASYPPPAQFLPPSGTGFEPGAPTVRLSDGTFYTFRSKKAATEYQNSLDTLGSVRTATRVKDNNSFARILTDALNKKEYQDIFNMGLLNTNQGKTLAIKAQVSAPTGGSINATIDIQYDPISNKFILVQNNFDAFSGV